MVLRVRGASAGERGCYVAHVAHMWPCLCRSTMVAGWLCRWTNQLSHFCRIGMPDQRTPMPGRPRVWAAGDLGESAGRVSRRRRTREARDAASALAASRSLTTNSFKSNVVPRSYIRDLVSPCHSTLLPLVGLLSPFRYPPPLPRDRATVPRSEDEYSGEECGRGARRRLRHVVHREESRRQGCGHGEQ